MGANFQIISILLYSNTDYYHLEAIVNFFNKKKDKIHQFLTLLILSKL